MFLALSQDLSCEVAGRLSAANVRCKGITLKVKQRQQGAPEPAKFLGCGACDNFSRSITLGRYVSTAADIAKEAVAMLAAMKIPHEEIRGIGITVGWIGAKWGWWGLLLLK
jgi:DNA repair protein REV1